MGSETRAGGPTVARLRACARGRHWGARDGLCCVPRVKSPRETLQGERERRQARTEPEGAGLGEAERGAQRAAPTWGGNGAVGVQGTGHQGAHLKHCKLKVKGLFRQMNERLSSPPRTDLKGPRPATPSGPLSWGSGELPRPRRRNLSSARRGQALRPLVLPAPVVCQEGLRPSPLSPVT